MKLNGYRATHRNKWKLLTNNTLSIQQLSYFEYCIDVMDFDPSHEVFGCFIVDYKETANIFFKSENTIRSWNKKLVDLKILTPTDRKRMYKITNPKRYLNKGKFQGEANNYAREEKNESIETILQNIVASSQLNEEKIQSVVKNDKGNLEKPPSIAISSYKVDYPFISNELEYKEVEKTIDGIYELIKDDFFNNDEGAQKLVRDYEYLANISLDYEVKNNRIPL